MIILAALTTAFDDVSPLSVFLVYVHLATLMRKEERYYKKLPNVFTPTFILFYFISFYFTLFYSSLHPERIIKILHIP
jgi:hypothetical protein